MDQVQLNVKGFLANERTFLHWLSLCTVLGAVSIALLNFGGQIAQTSAIVFGACAVAFMLYSLYQFHARAHNLSHGKKDPRAKGLGFEDINGAVALVIVVFIAVGINFGLNFFK